MSKQTINIGASPNDGTGTPLRTSFDYTNQNFTELYTALGGGVGLPGATTQVIFNDGGTNLAGDAGLVYNKTTDALTVAGLVTAGSATITGDLTVDTSTLKVDSANDRVGIGTASPAAGAKLGVTGATVVSTSDYIGSSTWAARFTGSSNGASSGISFLTNSSSGFPAPASIHATPITDYRAAITATYSADGSGAGYFAVNRFNPTGANTLEHYKIDNDGVATWSNVGGVAGTAMTLNSTGLGIGGSLNAKLQVTDTSVAAATALVRFVGQSSYNLDIQSLNNSVSTVGNRFNFNIGSGGGEFSFSNSGGTRMYLDQSGNLGIGVTPSLWGAGSSIQLPAGAGNSGIFTSNRYALFGSNAYNNAGWKYIASEAAAMYVQDTGSHAWFNAAGGTAGNAITDFSSAKMTLDASGNLLVGLTVDSYTPAKGVSMFSGNSSRVAVGHANGTLSGDYYHSFAYNSTLIGSISQNGTTGVLYNIVSDYRLKESVVPLSGGLARVNALKPSVYNWKSDGSTGEGFLAHELAEVVPFAVSGDKDAVNADGTIKSQGIDMSRIVPILVAAIQELTARVQTLEAR